jgi:xanthine dehydrogenase large subunit
MILHEAAKSHVTGESRFIDDIPTLARELQLGLVLSSVARGKIKRITGIPQALAVKGILGIHSAKDFKNNLWGTIFQDQPLLAKEEVNYHGEPVLIVVGESLNAIREAKKHIEIQFDNLPPVLDIPTAIERKMFVAPTRQITRGNILEGFRQSEQIIESVLQIHGQEHFYLEPQTALAIPEEQDQIRVMSSTQHPTEVQHTVAHSLGLPYQKIVSEVSRLGGGFGGKESQATPFAAYVSLIAHLYKRPARIVLSRDEDMIITGKRNPFHIFYKVGFLKNGEIKAAHVRLFSDSGAYADLSTSIMERAMLHSDNAYFIPNVVIEGTVCRTHKAPTTAFRGFGGPKGVAFIENILDEIARSLRKDPLEIRKVNVYRPGANTTPYGQTLEDPVLPILFKTLETSSGYYNRRKEIDTFNKESQEFLRGLSCTAVKFGISFTTRFLNQGAALVNLQTDGSVQVSTGAVEMGQGVNTKIQQTVSEAFGIPQASVRVMHTSTEKIHNTSPTAASSGADINASAALKACDIIKTRLSAVARYLWESDTSQKGRMNHVLGKVPEIPEKFFENPPILEFKNGFVYSPNAILEKLPLSLLIQEAYLHRVHLGALAFFKYPGIFFDKEKGQGVPFFYFTQGTAVSEVQINRFTGELKVLRTDILMDLGRPLNLSIDRGQTLGAFVQGMGWVTSENLFYSKEGALLTHAPSTYKIPSIQDIPREIHIDFFQHDANSKNIKASKAVGEPPLLLALSVWLAAKDAISYGCPEHIKHKIKDLPIPLTQERIFEFLHYEKFNKQA